MNLYWLVLFSLTALCQRQTGEEWREVEKRRDEGEGERNNLA